MEASSGKRQCLPQADDDDVPPTLEAARRMQQQSLLRGLEELSRREGDLTLVLDGGVELRASRVVLMPSAFPMGTLDQWCTVKPLMCAAIAF